MFAKKITNLQINSEIFMYDPNPSLEEIKGELFVIGDIGNVNKEYYIAIDKEYCESLEINSEESLQNYQLYNLFENCKYDEEELDLTFVRNECFVFNLEYVKGLKLNELVNEIAYGESVKIYNLLNFSGRS